MGRSIKIENDHDFYCTRCGKKGIPVCREGNMRKAGHLKILYCLNCKCEINHAECIEGSGYNKELFFAEWKSGNFDSEGKRKKPLIKWKARHSASVSKAQVNRKLTHVE